MWHSPQIFRASMEGIPSHRPGLSRTSTGDAIIEHNVFSGNNAANPSTDPHDLLTLLSNGLGLLLMATNNSVVRNNVITDNQTTGMARRPTATAPRGARQANRSVSAQSACHR
jgi:hypothetical protein